MSVCKGAPTPSLPVHSRHRHISWRPIYLCRYVGDLLGSSRKNCNFQYRCRGCINAPGSQQRHRNFYMCKPLLCSFLNKFEPWSIHTHGWLSRNSSTDQKAECILPVLISLNIHKGTFDLLINGHPMENCQTPCEPEIGQRIHPSCWNWSKRQWYWDISIQLNRTEK